MRMLRVILSAGLLFGLARDAASQTFWKEAPEKTVLVTGLNCIYQQDATSPTTVVLIFVAGGRGAVPGGLDGLASLAAQLSVDIPDQGAVRDLMGQATRFLVSTWEDCAIIHVECLSENLEAALRVASEIVQDPLLTGVRIDRVKKMMSLRGRAEQDDPVASARNSALRAFYGSHGYGTATVGTEESLRSIERRDVVAFHRRFFTAAGLFFCVGSDLDGKTVRSLLEKYFRKIPAGGAVDLPPAAPSLPDDRDIVVVKDSRQTYVGRAFALPAPDPAVYAKTLLLEIILGRGPGSRLWDLRAAGELAYSVNAQTVWTRSSAVLQAYLETETAKVATASAALDKALEILFSQGVSEDELAAAKTMAGSYFLRSVEVKQARTRTVGLFEVLGLGSGYLSGIFEAVDAVNLTELNVFIKEVLDPGRALRITVGPAPAYGNGPRQLTGEKGIGMRRLRWLD